MSADDGLLVEVVHRFGAALLVTGTHPELRWALSEFSEQVVAGDPWLTLYSALIRIEDGDARAEADLRRVGELFPAEPDPRLAVLRSVAELFGAATAADLAAEPHPLDEEQRRFDDPVWSALALVCVGGRGLLADPASEASAAALADALELARRHGFRYLEMQCSTLLAGLAGLAGDYRAMTAAAIDTLAVAATTRGWDRSPWSAAARWMLAYSALMRADPVEARRYASEGLQRGGTALRPRSVFALRALHGAALFDSGRRHEGLQQMQQARAGLGAVPVSAEQAATLAVLEHHAAVVLGRLGDARAVAEWLFDRIGMPGEVLLMQAWEKLSVGRRQPARADIEPILAGTVPSVLPYTRVEALLVEASVDISGGHVHTAGDALRTALSSGASLDVVRPFALAAAEARELLGSNIAGSTSTERFAKRALAAGRRYEQWSAHLDAGERQVIALLSSPLSVEQIARELDIPIADTQARMRMIYHKLGVSSRRSAVTAALERGLLQWRS